MRDEVIEEEEQIAAERNRDEARLAAAVLQLPICDLPALDPVITCAYDAPLRQAIDAIQQQRTASVLILNQGRVVGIFTERDALDKVLAREVDIDRTPVHRYMTPDPDCLSPDDLLVYALNAMSGGGYRNIPLIDANGHPVAVVSMRDIVDYLVSLFPEDVLNIPPSPKLEAAQRREGA